VKVSSSAPAKKKKTVRVEAERQHSCMKCGKSYMAFSSLLTHMRHHTGERPFACKQCDKTFIQSGHLSSHMRLHTGERRHACYVCGKRFGATSDLKVQSLRIKDDFVFCN